MNERLRSRVPLRAPGTKSGFRQRCASALTHPATVAALAILLLNDVLFKALWPESWVTGKLSDLAWVVFAPPLLAFLLSFLTRRNVLAERVSFLAAYAGLPLLYAAFNTFEPLHHWILQGLSIASGGTAGSPLDVTDSLVIPLGMGIAFWVWRQRVVGPATQRLRWGLLVAGVAALASVATSVAPPDYGIREVGVSAGGIVHAHSSGQHDGRYQSHDGGLNWTEGSTDAGTVKWGGMSAETPRGRYVVMGSDIKLEGGDGRSERVFSTANLRWAGNMWVQQQDVRDITTEPQGIVYDARSGNLIVAMGRQGVLVGTHDGRWTRYAVGDYAPTDFSFTAKTRLLLSKFEFWMVAVALSLSMTGAALIYSQHDAEDSRPLPIARLAVFVLLAAIVSLVVVGAALAAAFLFGLNVFWGHMLWVLPAAPVLAGIALGAMPRQSKLRKVLVSLTGALSLMASGGLLVMFGRANPDDLDYGLYFVLLSVPAYILGITLLLTSWRQLRRWPAAIASFVGMIVLVVLAFMLWLHLSFALASAKIWAVVLIALVAFVLAGYLKRKAT